ncbi:hypothetical protein [Kitasatospora sp. NPDC086791]|uniref:hypothetical protein n=1 Tax=Kitasatospora sp. NPDC086791 TaxID=3155178 RepID=UPI0034380BA2
MGVGPLALALAVLSLAVPAAPAFASAGGDSGGTGNGSGPAQSWGPTAAAVCLSEVALVPVLGGGSLGEHVDDHVRHCGDGNVGNLVDRALG